MKQTQWDHNQVFTVAHCPIKLPLLHSYPVICVTVRNLSKSYVNMKPKCTCFYFISSYPVCIVAQQRTKPM